MIKATILDKSTVVDILSHSFKSNKSVGFIVGDGINYIRRRRKLMEYSFLTCLDFGEVWLSECRTCCALTLFPQRKRGTLKTTFRAIDLLFSVIGFRLFKVLKRERLIRVCYEDNDTDLYHAPENAVYLWFIGTSPGFQGQGKGTVMLNSLLNKAGLDGKTVYLETSVEGNLRWYKAFGFKVYDQINLGFPLYFLKKQN